MNRKARRKALKGSQPAARTGFRQPTKDTAPVVQQFTPETSYRLRYDISVPGGLLRSEYPAQQSGVLEAATPSDLMRGAFVKLLDAYGYTAHPRAVAGLLGDVFGPLPKSIRGNIALNIIEGLGLYLSLNEEEVCDDPKCSAIMERQIHPDPESVEGYDAGDEESELPMLDVTKHASECHVHREVEPEHPEQSLRPATYKPEEVLSINNPRYYEPLQNKAIDPETGEVTDALTVPETGGEPVDTESTVDADSSEEAVPIVTEEEDVRPTAVVDTGAGARTRKRRNTRTKEGEREVEGD